MLYNIVAPVGHNGIQTPQIEALAKILFGGYEFIPTDPSDELDVKYAVNIVAKATGVNDVILINMKNVDRMNILDELQKNGIRAVINLSPEQLLMSPAWDDIRRLIAISEMEHNNPERKLLDSESIIDIINKIGIKVDHEELNYSVEIVIEEMARKALKEVMTSK